LVPATKTTGFCPFADGSTGKAELAELNRGRVWAMSEHALMVPAAEASETVEALLITYGRTRPTVFWMTVVGLTIALAALPFLRVDTSVRASVMVRPALEKSDLHAPTAGYVAEVFAHDNQTVQADQVLLRLDASAVEQSLAIKHQRLTEIEAQLADYTQMLAAPPAQTYPVRPTQLALGNEWDQYQADLLGNDLNRERAIRELERNRRLRADDAISAREIDAATDQRDDAVQRSDLVRQQWRSRWRASQVALEQELHALQIDIAQLQESLVHYTIRAPSAGCLLGFTDLSAGAYVQAGQTLGALTPTADLVVEAMLPPKDIACVRAGQPCRIALDALPSTTWGFLPAKVIMASEDVTVVNGTPYFRVVLAPLASSMRHPSGTTVHLRRGMTGTVRLLTGRMTLLQLLYDQADHGFNPAEGPPRD
jgi:multidrug resistance efflux pump